MIIFYLNFVLTKKGSLWRYFLGTHLSLWNALFYDIVVLDGRYTPLLSAILDSRNALLNLNTFWYYFQSQYFDIPYTLYTLFLNLSVSLPDLKKECRNINERHIYRIYLADQKKNGEISKHDSSNDDAARFHALTGVVWGALCTLHFAPSCTSSKATDWVTPGRSPAVITPPHSPAQAQSITHSPPGSWSTWLFRFWVG